VSWLGWAVSYRTSVVWNLAKWSQVRSQFAEILFIWSQCINTGYRVQSPYHLSTVREYRLMIWKQEFGRWQYYKEWGQDMVDNTKLGPRASQQERQCNWPTMTALIKASISFRGLAMFQSHCCQKDSLHQVNWNQQQMDSWNSSKINTAIRMRHSRDSDQRGRVASCH